MKYFIALLLGLHSLSASAQSRSKSLHLGVDITQPAYRQFTRKEDTLDNDGQRTNSQIWMELRFKTKTSGSFAYQNGVRLDFQDFNRRGLSDGNTFRTSNTRLPITWTQTVTRSLQSENLQFGFTSGVGGILASLLIGPVW